MTNKIDEGGYVYPPSFEMTKHPFEDAWPEARNGITRRNWLAGLAMQARAGKPATAVDVRECYEWADYMIAESKQGTEQ
jgi:hypothetical protein